jgi:ribosomal protein S18 acetylase RimI-like enzyme
MPTQSTDLPKLDPIGPADFEPIAALAREIWLAHYISIITKEQIEYMLDGRFTPANLQRYVGASDRWMYVLRLNEMPVGYCSCALTDVPGEMKLEQLYLQPALHGRGFGKYMLEHVENKARENACETLILQVNKRNTGAIEVYRRTGFRVRKEIVLDIGHGYVMDDFIMQKKIELQRMN